MTAFDAGVSVVIPTYLGAKRLPATLRSLAEQTISRELMQVVVVPNGPDDGTLELLERFRHRHSDIDLRIARVTRAGVAHATNVGLLAAGREYVTFVDDDDTVSDTYLEGLLKLAGPDVVGVGFLADVTDDGEGDPDYDTYVNASIVGHAGRRRTPSELSAWLGFNVCKIVRTDQAQTVRVREDLVGGTDIVYWTELAERFKLSVNVARTSAHVVYYRTTRTGSLSRPTEVSPERGIGAKLDVIDLMMPIAQDPGAWTHKAAREHVFAQARHIGSFLATHPDLHQEALRQIAARGYPEFPYKFMNRDRARDLVIAYAFPPTNDTSAIVAAKRVRLAGVAVDVVSHRMKRIRDLDPGISALTAEYVGNQKVVGGEVSLLNWGGFGRFLREGWEAIEGWEADRGQPYRSVYSRTMWPASHVLAALYKLRRPEVKWRAEFSDPLLYDSNGKIRESAMPDGPLAREILAGLDATPYGSPPSRNVPEIVEHLAYQLADEIVFTNQHQMQFMLDHVDDPALVERIRERAIVAHHPTLDPSFYQLGHVDYPLDPARANIGYFGMFYASRSLTEVVDAIALLTPEERSKVALHVFTRDPRKLAKQLKGRGLDDVIKPTGFLPYLDFLAVTKTFDVLLVNDAKVTDSHGINPYLPSKISDYSGSGSDVWSLVEDGSVLSSIDTRYMSPLGDVDRALAVLRSVIADHAR
ncbi:hypothetical protein GCM10022234_10630 [Aeromicrobium panaciterrae]|uniref:glycosyltransferase n=1 Tax=Aeromicrobium panaciterrae TaxID=363861 RepID=UPI0031D80F05